MVRFTKTRLPKLGPNDEVNVQHVETGVNYATELCDKSFGENSVEIVCLNEMDFKQRVTMIPHYYFVTESTERMLMSTKVLIPVDIQLSLLQSKGKFSYQLADYFSISREECEYLYLHGITCEDKLAYRSVNNESINEQIVQLILGKEGIKIKKFKIFDIKKNIEKQNKKIYNQNKRKNKNNKYNNKIEEEKSYEYMEFLAKKKLHGNYRSQRVHPNKKRKYYTQAESHSVSTGSDSDFGDLDGVFFNDSMSDLDVSDGLEYDNSFHPIGFSFEGVSLILFRDSDKLLMCAKPHRKGDRSIRWDLNGNWNFDDEFDNLNYPYDNESSEWDEKSYSSDSYYSDSVFKRIVTQADEQPENKFVIVSNTATTWDLEMGRDYVKSFADKFNIKDAMYDKVNKASIRIRHDYIGPILREAHKMFMKLHYTNEILQNMIPSFTFWRDVCVETVILVYRLVHDRSFSNIMLSMYQYARVIGVDFKFFADQIDKLKEYVLQDDNCLFFDTDDCKVITQAEEAPENKYGWYAFISKILDSKIVDIIKKIMVTAAGYKLFPKSFSSKVYACFGFFKPGNIIELFHDGAKAVFSMMRVSDMIESGMPIFDALFCDDPVDQLNRDIKDLLLYDKRTFSGIPVDNYMDETAYVAKSHELVGAAVAMKKRLSKKDHKYRVLSENLLELQTSHMDHVNRLTSNDRMMPIGICIVGPPGIGKSLLIHFSNAIICRYFGVEYNPKMMFGRIVNSDYWDEHIPWSQRIVHYSELGNLHVDIASKSGDPGAFEITSLIDTLSFPLNRSKAEEKGRFFACPWAVVVDTNNEDMNFRKVLNNSDAARRRFIYVQLKVKQEFQKANSYMLDSAKSLADNTALLDRFEIEAYRSIPSGNGLSHNESIYHTDDGAGNVKVSGDIYDYAIALEAEIKKHFDIQKALLSKPFNDMPVEYYLNEDNRGKPIQFIDNSLIENYMDGDEKVISQEYHTESMDHIIEAADNVSRVIYWAKDVPYNYVRKKWELLCDWILPYEENNIEALSTTYHLVLLGLILMITFVVSPLLKNMPILKHNIKRLLVLLKLLCIVLIYVCFYFHNVWSFMFFIVLVAIVIFVPNYENVSELSLSMTRKVIRQDRKYMWKRFKYMFGWNDKFNPFHASWVMKHKKQILLLTGSIGTIYAGYKLFSRTKDDEYVDGENHKGYYFYPDGTTKFFHYSYGTKTISSESTFRLSSKENEEMSAIENTFDMGGSYKRVKNKNDMSWNVRIMAEPPVFTGTCASLYDTFRRNIRFVIVDFRDGTKERDSHICGVEGDIALINTHAVRDGRKSFWIHISHTGAYDVLKDQARSWREITPRDIQLVEGDVSLIRIRGEQFSKKIMKHFVDREEFARAPGYIGNTEVETLYIKDKFYPYDAYSKVELDGYFYYMWPKRPFGPCGIPLVIARGKGCSIVGIHAAGGPTKYDNHLNVIEEFPESFAAVVDKRKLESALSILKEKNPLMNVSSESTFNLSLYPPHPKSAFRHETLHGIKYYGSLGGDVMIKKKSSLKDTVFRQEIERYFRDEIKFVPTKHYVPPLLEPKGRGDKYVNPYNNALRHMAHDMVSLDVDLLEYCVKELVCELEKCFGDEKLRPLDFETAINGDELDDYLRRMEATTSSGFGWNGPKSAHLPITLDEPGKRVREPSEALKIEIIKSIKTMLEDETPPFYTETCLKDEPREEKKAASGNTRLFCVASITEVVLWRCFLAPFYTSLVQHGRKIGVSVGINIYRDADNIAKAYDLYDHAFEGDYEKYDYKLPFDLKLASSTVVERVLSRHYNEKSMRVVRALLSGGLFARLIVVNDLIVVPGLQGSGRYATAEENSIANVLGNMYSFYSLQKSRALRFFDNVLPNDYGDDLLTFIKARVASFFNGETYQKFCKEIYHINFTSSDKKEVVDKFVTKDKMTFLKRRFVYSKEFDRYVPPLEMDSIFKSLVMMNPSRFAPETEQIEGILKSALMELFFHVDEDLYEKTRVFFISLFNKYYSYYTCKGIIDMTRQRIISIMGYDEPIKPVMGTDIIFESQSEEASDKVGNGGLFSPLLHTTPVEKSANLRQNVGTMSLLRSFIGHNRNLEKFKHELEMEMKEAEGNAKTGHKTVDCLNLHQLQNAVITSGNGKLQKAVRERIKYLSIVENNKTAIEHIENILGRKYHVLTESADHMSEGPIDPDHEYKNGNVEEVTGEPISFVSAGKYMNIAAGQKETLGLNKFFERPVQIYKGAITLATNFDVNLRPWDLWSLVPSVRAKLRNYAYFKGDLHMRFMVTGTPFHSGRLLVSYQPFSNANSTLAAYLGADIFTTALRFNKMCYMSQAPGTFVMDMKNNKPIEVTYPFISHKPMHRLFNTDASALGASSSYDDMHDAGSVYIMTLTQALSTTDNSAELSIYVYAWMTDVELGAPTATVVGITTESQDHDERKSGPVENISSAVAKINEQFETIPVIGKYAKASSISFGTLAKIAAIYGWSRPLFDPKPMYVKNLPFLNSANCIGFDSSIKVSIDPKQELTVDPRICGVESDDMSIAAICARESLWTFFTWTDASVPMVPIWKLAVSPWIVTAASYSTPSAVTFVQPTALAYAAQCFAYWRGDITIRLDVVCSSFHRGTFAVVYEPNTSQSVLISAGLSLNKQYLRIIDIQETQSVEFCIKWNSSREWLRTAVGTSYEDLSTTIPSTTGVFNGFIMVIPITNLTSPTESGVTFNCFVRSDNMQFAYPTDSNFPNWRRIVSQSTDHISDTIGSTCLELNPSSASMKGIGERYFGEIPKSFRLLMKRFSTVAIYTVTSGAYENSRYILTLNRYPDMISPYTFGSASPTNISDWFSYLRYGFLGMRGGTRVRVRPYLSNGLQVDVGNIITVSNPGVTSSSAATALTVGTSSINANSRVSGTALFAMQSNPGLEVELPFYSNNLYGIAFDETYDGTASLNLPGLATDDYETTWVRTATVTWTLMSNTNGQTMNAYVDYAFAEDGTLMRFMGAPYYTR